MWDLVVKHQKILFVAFIIITFLHAAITVSYASMISFLTAYVTGRIKLPFYVMVIICLTFSLMTAAINILGGFYKGKVTNGSMLYLRGKMFAHFLTISTQKLKVGSRVAFLTSKIDVVNENYVGSLLYGISLFFQLFFSFILSVLINVQLTMLVLVLEIPALLLPTLSQRFLKRAKEPVLNKIEIYTGNITNWFSGISIIRNFGRQNTFESKHYDDAKNVYSAENHDILIRKIVSGISQLFGDLVYLGSWLIGGLFVLKGRISFPSFMAFTQLAVSISFPLEAFADVFSDYFGGLRAYQEFEEELGQPVIKKNGSTNVMPVNTPAGTSFIQYSNSTISDSTDTAQVLLHDINASIDMNEKVIVIGESGSGKTTLVSTLFGQHRLIDGRILVNGVSLESLPNNSLSSLIGFQEQKTFIFDGTVRDNVTLFSDKFSDQKICEALKQSGFIKEDFSIFLNHKISTAGNFMSGGERQRLGLARNLLVGKKFMIFDELSSGLDRVTAKKIEKTLFSLDSGFIYITHNYDQQLLHMADQVLEVKNKTVQELQI